MNIVVLYATNSGGTYQASQTVESALTKNGHTVTVQAIVETDPSSLSSFDLIIMGSPSWDYEDTEGQPHEDFIHFMKKIEGQPFSGKKFAVFGLGDSFYKHFCGAVDILENFVKEKGGSIIFPSLRIDGYYANLDKYTKELEVWSEKVVL